MTRALGIALLVLALSLCGGRGARAQDTAGGGWRLAFAVDSAGRALYGSRAEVEAAARAGLPVRVGWGIPWRLPDGTVIGVEHVADAAFLTLHRGEVFAQLHPIVRQVPSADSAAIGLVATETWVGLLDTTGRLRGVFRESGRAHEQRLRIWWYVRDARGAGTERYVPDRLH